MENLYQNMENEFVIYNDENRHVELEISPLTEIDVKEQNSYVNKGGVVIMDKTQRKYYKILYS